MTLKTVAITSGATWTPPSDAYGSIAQIICIGAGGAGQSGTAGVVGGTGGTSGCIVSLNTITITGSGTENIQVGTGDTWFRSSSTVIAKAAQVTTTGCIGDTKVAGRLGAAGGAFSVCNGYSVGGPGAGCPGLSTTGSGQAAGTPTYTLTAGGTAGPGTGGDAPNGGISPAGGSPGGNYGAGGGGGGDSGCVGAVGGAGAHGVIIVIYTPSQQQGAPNQDFTNPVLRLPNKELYTHVSPSAVINTLLNITYAVPFNETDWPLPNRGAYHNRDIVNFNDPVELNLLSKDQMIWGTGGASRNFDWPVPKGKEYPSDLRFYSLSLNNWYASQTAYYTPGMGMPQLDWPVPKGYQRVVDEKTWVWNQTLPMYNLELSLEGFKGPWFQNDWPVPKGPQQPLENKTFIFNGALWQQTRNKVYYSPGSGVPQLDYPNPRGYIYPSELRTWVQHTNLQLLEQTKFFYSQGMGPNYDYPNPRGYRQPNYNYNINQRAVIFTRAPYSFSIIMG